MKEKKSILDLGKTALVLEGITKVDYLEGFTENGKDLLIITGDHGEPITLLVENAPQLAHEIALRTGILDPVS